MKQFYSLSLHPGKTGEYYFNRMFAKLRLPYTYKALPCTNVGADILKLREEGATGISISMPFKTQVLNLLDHSHPFVKQFNSCNSIKIIDDELYGHNTDAGGAFHVISLIPDTAKIAILGDGAMGSMFKKILGDRAMIYSRKNNNWEERYGADDVIINCTPFGTSTPESPFDIIPTCNLVIDLAIKDNHLDLQCQVADVKYIGGLIFYRHQFLKQFGFYTGIPITLNDMDNL